MAPSSNAIDLIAPLGAGLVIAGSFLLLRPLLLRMIQKSALHQDTKPIPIEWFSLLQKSVPATRHLSELERTQLLRASRQLIATRHWEGCGGLELTPDMQLIIAAQGALLTLGIPGEPFPGLREILVYPRTFVGRRVCDPRQWLATSEPSREVPELGESWGNGIIVLAWESALEGAQDPKDGRNVVFHEFAHELAYEHHLAPKGLSIQVSTFAGVVLEAPPDVPDPTRWERVIEESYQQLCAKVEGQASSTLNRYGATNKAEFFAVATEAFFERPGDLSREFPALFDELRGFYRQDPLRLAAG